MNNWVDSYREWKKHEHLDPLLKKQLNEIKNNKQTLEEAFHQELTFGTGGMRGILGPGTNRMNIYTVRKAVKGLATYLKENFSDAKERGVVVAYDSRYMSKEFALESAKVLGVYGIKTYVFTSLRPTPLLSFAVRHLKTVAGIMITASHNPPEYNGFKVYNEDGGQMTLAESDEVIEAVQRSGSELTVDILEKEELLAKDLLHWLEDEIDHVYLEHLKQITKMDDNTLEKDKDLSIVFTPLHGTANNLVTKGLQQLNFTNVHVVQEQAIPDPEFSTVKSPNPEEAQAFALAERLGTKQDADILLATDPDADRLGVAVKNDTGTYDILTGNQLGSLLLDYILIHSDKATLKDARMLKTIVTTELGRSIATSYGVQTRDTLTGFKFISEKIRQYDTSGESFVFGFEESYGYLIDSFARDKDAVQAVTMAAEMAHYWKTKGKTLLDALYMLYEKHGFFLEGILQLTLEGIEGTSQINAIMDHSRNYNKKEIAGIPIIAIEDYLTGERTNIEYPDQKETIDLPEENVVKFILEEDTWVCLRPSGTEPKIKCYFGVCTSAKKSSKQRLITLQKTMEQIMNETIK